MTTLLLVVAAIVDLAIAALLVAVSGFLFGHGPEGMHGGMLMLASYSAAVIACVAAPIVAFVLSHRGKSAAGLMIAWTPPVGALLAFVIPAPY